MTNKKPFIWFFKNKSPPQPHTRARAAHSETYKSNSTQTSAAPKKPNIFDKARQRFENMDDIKRHTMDCLNAAGKKGETTYNLNGKLAALISQSPRFAKALLTEELVKSQLMKARDVLMEERRITYNGQKKIWYSLEPDPFALPSDIKKSLRRRYPLGQAVGNGWYTVSSQKHAIGWIYENLTAEEFEYFCAALLKHCKVPHVQVTSKRRMSGADGGLDGIGHWDWGHGVKPIGLQAKKHNPDKQLGDNELRIFYGTLRSWDTPIYHGFLMTTAIFSPKLIQKNEQIFKDGVEIELIDQKRLAQMMLSGNGYGLFETSVDQYVIHPDFIKKSASHA